jgi:DNA-3-methyladenine glycosylase II
MTRLTHSIRCELQPEPPYDFELTVHKPAGWPLFTPFELFDSGTLWTATHLCERLVGIKLASPGTTSRPRLAVRLFLSQRPSRVEAQAMKQRLCEALGVEDSLAEFYELASVDRILSHAVRHLRGMHDTSGGTLFSEACLAILLQMAPLARSEAMMSTFIARYGPIAEFDGKKIRAWPTAERIAAIRPLELARSCNVGYRAKLLVALANRLADGTFPSIEQLRAMPPAEAKRLLMQLPGIGDYSADIINPHGGFPIDAWSVEVFSQLFYGKVPARNRDSIDKVKREGLRRWGRWAWLAFFYVAQDLPKLSEALGMELRLE